MSYVRLTFVGFAAAALVLSGCAGPAWLAHGELSLLGKRRSSATSDEAPPEEPHRSKELAAVDKPRSMAFDAEPSLSQVLDDVERIKHRNPSDFAVIQSAIETASSDLSPRHQQLLRDQAFAMALSRQEQASQSIVQQPVPPPRYVPDTYQPAPSLRPKVAVQAGVTPASYAAEVPPEAAPPNTLAPHGTPVTTYVGDMMPTQISSATNSVARAPATPVTSVAVDVAEEKEPEPGRWRPLIEQALASLSADIARSGVERDEKARLEVVRRLLYVATNQREAAVAPIDQFDEDELEYWKHQLHGLLVSIDADGKHPTTRRAALALRDLRTAADHLANVSTLDVRNLNFCSEVLSYGEYRVFDSYTFRAKDEVVLYVEVVNFAAHPRSDSFETELHSSYEIMDDAGRRVANVVLPVDKQVSRNRRHDYFIAHLITMPTQIAAGSYRLRLTIEDVIGKKSNHATIDFRIK